MSSYADLGGSLAVENWAWTENDAEFLIFNLLSKEYASVNKKNLKRNAGLNNAWTYDEKSNIKLPAASEASFRSRPIYQGKEWLC